MHMMHMIGWPLPRTDGPARGPGRDSAAGCSAAKRFSSARDSQASCRRHSAPISIIFCAVPPSDFSDLALEPSSPWGPAGRRRLTRHRPEAGPLMPRCAESPVDNSVPFFLLSRSQRSTTQAAERLLLRLTEAPDALLRESPEIAAAARTAAEVRPPQPPQSPHGPFQRSPEFRISSRCSSLLAAGALRGAGGPPGVRRCGVPGALHGGLRRGADLVSGAAGPRVEWADTCVAAEDELFWSRFLPPRELRFGHRSPPTAT